MRLGVASKQSYVVKKSQQDAEQGVVRIDACCAARRMAGGVAVEQARHGESGFQGVTQIVVKRIATQQAGIFAAIGTQYVGHRGA